MAFDLITIDFETSTSSCNSACSLGIACVSDLNVVHTEYHLIKPPSLLFSKKNISIHGITALDVADMPTFPVIWNRISHYFDGNTPIFAHNAKFDMSVLYASLQFYNLPLPNFLYGCSIPFTGKSCEYDTPKSLPGRAEFYGVEIPNHHNAQCDAEVCAKIMIETVRRSRQKNFRSFCNIRAIYLNDFTELKPQKGIGNEKFENIDYESVPQDIVGEADPIFAGKSVVITGDFPFISRRELSQFILSLGGVIKTSVSKKTDYLLVGVQDISLVGEDGLSQKQEKAAELIASGVPITVLFLNQVSALLKEHSYTPTGF